MQEAVGNGGPEMNDRHWPSSSFDQLGGDRIRLMSTGDLNGADGGKSPSASPFFCYLPSSLSSSVSRVPSLRMTRVTVSPGLC